MSALAAALRYRSLVDRVGAIVWEAIPGTRAGEATFTFVSEGTEALLGYPAQRWLADTTFWFQMIHPDDRDGVNRAMAGAAHAASGTDFEYRVRAADGREVWLRNIVQPDTEQGEFRFTGVLIDITERKVADARLLRLQELTDELAGILAAHEVAAIVATRGRAAAGAAATAVFLRDGDQLELAGYDGYPGQELRAPCTIPLEHDVPAAEAARTGQPIVLDAAALQARYPAMTDVPRLGGSGHFVALPLLDSDRVLGSIALRMAEDRPLARADRVVLDVLVRSCVAALLRAEHSASERDARAQLDTIITKAPEGFALFDTDLRYVRVNDAMAAINGIPAAEHAGRTLEEIVPDVPEAGHADPLRRVLATGEPIVDLEVSGRTAADPGERTWLVSYYPVPGAAGEICWLGCFAVDITERKRSEERAHLFAALGSLLDEVVSVSERMDRLVAALVPDQCSTAAIFLLGDDEELERVAVRGADEPAITVPLLVRGRNIGVLALTPSRPMPGVDDIVFATEMARRAALAVDNARLYEAERVARERTGRQYSVAAGLAHALTSADVAAATLAEVVPAVGAEHGTVWQLSEDGERLTAIGWAGFGDDEMEGYRHASLSDRRPVADGVRTGQRLWLATPEEIDAAYPAMAPGMRARGLQSIAVFPLATAGRLVGGLLVSSTRPHALGAEDLALGTALAAQAAQALERARLFEAERRVSVTLQRSLLPASLPEVPGVEMDLRYLPAAGLEAGGDFYEALPLDDGSLLFAVGDVVGRGPTAAAAMGQLRSALRAFALVGEGPGEILRRLSAFADTVPEAMAATAVVARLDPETGQLRYACAGHPLPLLVHPAGSAEYLGGGRGVPLSCLPEPVYPEATVMLEPGATVLLYTDGLTERRGQDMDVMLERLRTATAGCAGAELTELLDCAVAGVGDAAVADDVAVVALRATGAAGSLRRLAFPAVLDQVPVARGAVREWLAEIALPRAAAADVLLACGEAVANAIEHSGSDRVELELGSPRDGAIAIVIRDRGAWRDPVASSHRGRGIGLMRALVDDCDVRHGPEGTTVRLIHAVEPAANPLVTADLGTAIHGCTVRVRGETAVLAGDLDAAAAAATAGRLAGAAPGTVDLSAVGYLDSTGARMLLGLPGRPAIVAPPGSAPRRALEVSQLVGVLDVRDA